MANESRSISGTVATRTEDGKHNVAYSLMNRIATSTGEDQKTKDRDYWLNLYAECWNVVTYGERKS